MWKGAEFIYTSRLAYVVTSLVGNVVITPALAGFNPTTLVVDEAAQATE
jgi:hypothetical protein